MAVTHGSTEFQADGNICLVSVNGRLDPNGAGAVWEYTYVGTESGINAKATELDAQLVRYTTSADGGTFTLVATYAGSNLGGNPSTDPSTDSWGFDTEGSQVSVWNHPTATIQANQYTQGAAAYRKSVTDALSEGSLVSFGDFHPVDFRNVLYTTLARGQDYYELRRPVLKRTRTAAPQWVDKFKAEGRQPVWTTPSLISVFAVPSDVQARLPADPPKTETPYGTIWAWLLTLDTGEYSIATRMWQETRQWVFGAFDPNFYVVT